VRVFPFPFVTDFLCKNLWCVCACTIFAELFYLRPNIFSRIVNAISIHFDELVTYCHMVRARKQPEV